MKATLRCPENELERHGQPLDSKSALILAIQLRAEKKPESALDLIQRWLPVADATTQCQFGSVLNMLGQFSQAYSIIADGLPFLSDAWARYTAYHELSVALYSLGRYDEAHSIFRQLREPGPMQTMLRVMLRSKGSEAWLQAISDRLLGVDTPVAGKRVLVLCEGGAGDTFMFYRYIEMLVREGAACVHIDAPPALHALLAAQPFGSPVSNASVHCYDSVTWSFSLFARYQLSKHFTTPQIAYLVNPKRPAITHITTRLLKDVKSNRRIGLVWRSDSKVRHEPYRSMSLQQMEPLIALSKNVTFFSLQMGPLQDDEQVILRRHGIPDIGSLLANFSDTAHILQELDLLISIDSGPIHLAGGLGRPVWAMLSAACDHRWYNCQKITPWYESVRLFKQIKLGDWAPVIRAARTALSNGS